MNDITMKQVAEVANKATEQQKNAPAKADAADKARFDDAMQTDQTKNTGQTNQVEQAQNATQVDSTQQVTATSGASGVQPQTGGSRILDNLDRMSADFRALKDSVHETAGKGGEMGEIIRLQMQVAEVTTTQTMVGKGGEKTGQGINQLVRGQ